MGRPLRYELSLYLRTRVHGRKTWTPRQANETWCLRDPDLLSASYMRVVGHICTIHCNFADLYTQLFVVVTVMTDECACKYYLSLDVAHPPH
jgi:hypothetical protein